MPVLKFWKVSGTSFINFVNFYNVLIILHLLPFYFKSNNEINYIFPIATLCIKNRNKKFLLNASLKTIVYNL